MAKIIILFIMLFSAIVYKIKTNQIKMRFLENLLSNKIESGAQKTEKKKEKDNQAKTKTKKIAQVDQEGNVSYLVVPDA